MELHQRKYKENAQNLNNTVKLDYNLEINKQRLRFYFAADNYTII